MKKKINSLIIKKMYGGESIIERIKNIKVLLKRDIAMNFKSIIVKLGLFFIIYAILNVVIVMNVSGYEIVNSKSIIMKLLQGCNYVVSSGTGISNDFKFPMEWLFINGYIIYVIGEYFYRDIKRNGIYLIVRCKRRTDIFISKIIYNFMIIILYYSLILSINVICGYIFQDNKYMYIDENYFKIEIGYLVIMSMILYSLTSMTLSIIFCTLTIKIKPIYSFLLCTVLCIVSVFSESKMLIGQHSLILRHLPFNNISFEYSIIFNIIVSILIFGIGLVLFKRKEVF